MHVKGGSSRFSVIYDYPTRKASLLQRFYSSQLTFYQELTLRHSFDSLLTFSLNRIHICHPLLTSTVLVPSYFTPWQPHLPSRPLTLPSLPLDSLRLLSHPTHRSAASPRPRLRLLSSHTASFELITSTHSSTPSASSVGSRTTAATSRAKTPG